MLLAWSASLESLFNNLAICVIFVLVLIRNLEVIVGDIIISKAGVSSHQGYHFFVQVLLQRFRVFIEAVE